MLVTFGKHEGKTVEELAIKDPGYIHWIFNVAAPSGALLLVKRHAEEVVAKIDAKPILYSCVSGKCGRKATRASVYETNTGLFWWCANCDPHQAGADRGKLRMISSYRDILAYSTSEQWPSLIEQLAKAKGQSGRTGSMKWMSFFLTSLGGKAQPTSAHRNPGCAGTGHPGA